MKERDQNIYFKRMKIFLIYFSSILFIINLTSEITPQENANKRLTLAGFRASRINSSYPGNVFPDENYWSYVGHGMSNKFANTNPSSVWLVSIYEGNGDTRVGFPYSSKNILSSDSDLNEEYLKRFDNEGIKIFLQVEPGSANVDTLINIVLNRYGSHSCVIGFGLDVEWLEADNYSEGRPVTDSEAQRWENLVKSFNKDYKLFLKHYNPEWMPKIYRGDIIFIDDGQQFTSLEEMKYYFKIWSKYFPDNKISFQIGYPSDEFWWDKFSDPAKFIGEELISSIPNIYGLYWVDFSVVKIFPMIITGIHNSNSSAKDYKLMQNYPNPFNPSTTIQYSVPKNGFVKIILYNILGKKVKTLVNGEKTAGNYTINFNSEDLTSGVYFYTLQSGKFVDTKKMILIR